MDRLTWFENNDAVKGMELGIISEARFSMYVHYLMYMDYRSKGVAHIQAIQQVADDRHTSFSVIYKSFSFFRKSELNKKADISIKFKTKKHLI